MDTFNEKGEIILEKVIPMRRDAEKMWAKWNEYVKGRETCWLVELGRAVEIVVRDVDGQSYLMVSEHEVPGKEGYINRWDTAIPLIPEIKDFLRSILN